MPIVPPAGSSYSGGCRSACRGTRWSARCGAGLLVAVEFGPTGSGMLNRLCPALVETITRGLFGQWVALRLLERGVICALTYHQWNILRLESPLTVKDEQVERVIDAVSEVLEEYRSVAPALKDTTLRLLQQFLAGWKF